MKIHKKKIRGGGVRLVWEGGQGVDVNEELKFWENSQKKSSGGGGGVGRGGGRSGGRSGWWGGCERRIQVL